MRFFLVVRIAAIACSAVVAAGQASGCQCGGGLYHGKSGWELAKLEVNAATVIFEGTPERFELQWDVLNAKEGDLVSASEADPRSNDGPHMLVTFRVQRAYRGNLGDSVQLKTGLGRGDCGAVYSPGLSYLIFAKGPTVSDLWVGMCSPGGWIGNRSVATELRYLRKERPIASDLVRFGGWDVKKYAAQERQRRLEFEEYDKRFATVTGKICGTISTEKTKDGNEGLVSFLSNNGFSPIDHPTVSVNPDGSFCSERLGPGRYYLYFTRWSEAGPTSAVFYPGVSERNKATVVDVSAGQTQSAIKFKVPVQKAYSVRGIISTNDTSGLDSRGAYVSLVRLDGGPFRPWYDKQIDFQGPFPLPKVKYFCFENVLPGRYIAYVSVLGQGWYTKKVEVNVTTHMKFISVQLEHKK